MIRSLTYLILISFLIYLCVSNPVPFVSFEDINFDSQSQKIISVRGGASNFNKKKPKNFDANFHRILQKGFPDWQRRIEYEQRQRELYESAQKNLWASLLQKTFFHLKKKMPLHISRGRDFTQIVKDWKKDPMCLIPARHFF